MKSEHLVLNAVNIVLTEVAFAKRHKTTRSLLLLDVDHFKRINDELGHLGGDSVLVALVRIVQSAIRTEDLFARYGGEEFVVLCRGATANEALVLAERLRTTIDAFAFYYNGQSAPVTVSVGVAAWFDQPDSQTRLVADADDALYEAKATGRNRVVVRAFQPC